MMSYLPTHPNAIRLDWLATVLGQPLGSLSGFTTSAVGTGQMCDSYRLKLNWSADANLEAPASIIAKCPSSDKSSLAIAKDLGNYVLEVKWYSELAIEVPVARPHCYFAEIAPNDVDFILLLGDLAPACQGDQLLGASLEAINLAVDEAAALHAALWNSPRLDTITWLNRDTRPLIKSIFPALYERFRERYSERLDPEHLELGAELSARIDQYLDWKPSARSLVHGDLRIDNILFSADGQSAYIVDWQTLMIGSPANDLAYLIGTSVKDATMRAANERDWFKRWMNALASHGVEASGPSLWNDYRVGALSGYFVAVLASMNVERTDRGDEMFAIMAERPARQALMLDSIALL